MGIMKKRKGRTKIYKKKHVNSKAAKNHAKNIEKTDRKGKVLKRVKKGDSITLYYDFPAKKKRKNKK
jgi:hypothetical protein